MGGALPAVHYIGKRSADADAFLYANAYGAYGAYPYGFAASYGVPFGSSTGLDPITQGLDPVTQGALPAVHHIGKRSADADAFLYANAYGAYGAYPYGFAATYAVPFGSSTGLDPITQGLDPVTQGALPAVHYIGKRSADADAFLYTNAYGAYGAYPYGFAATYGVPFGSSTGLDPITQGLDAVTQGAALPAYHYIG